MSPNDGIFDMLIGGAALIVISGPSGVGKDAVIMRLCQGNPAYHLLVTTTTRAPRVNERNGHHYVKGFSGVSAVEQDRFLEAHPGLYRRVGKAVCLEICEGSLDLKSLSGTGFGTSVLPDFNSMERGMLMERR